MKWQGWIITADWYDNMSSTGQFCGSVHRTRAEAISDFLQSFPESASWQRARRQGWRCVKCLVNW